MGLMFSNLILIDPNQNIIEKGEEIKYKNNDPLKEESEKIIWLLLSQNKDFLISFGNKFLKSLYEKGGSLEEVSLSLNEKTYGLKITYLLTGDLLEDLFSQKELQEYKDLKKESPIPQVQIIY